jgi:hypothetical protein
MHGVKSALFISFSIFFSISMLSADLSINQEELKKGHEVEFINYSGPYDKLSTIEEIRSVGVQLGTNFTKTSVRTTYHGLFSIIHIYDPLDKSGKYDADIFVIEPGSFMDHIQTMRIVIAGFLQTAYGYSFDDAMIIARFVTLYNAVFRGNATYFASAYKAKVMENISAADAGLALIYSEWPGRTKVLIPLSEGFEKGKLSSLDTQELTDEKVKEALRKEENKGIEDRKKIVELQEKQIEEKEKDLNKDKKAVAEEKKKLEEEKKKLEEEKKNTGETTATTTKENELKKKEEVIKKTEEDITKREEKITKAEEKLKNDRNEIATEERKITEKTASTTIAAVDTANPEKGYFLKVKDGEENEAGELTLYNFKDNTVEAKTTGLRIKERRLYIYNNMLLVVAQPAGKGASYLMFLDAKTLAVTKQSDEEVSKTSIVATQGNALYAVIKKGNSVYIGKFDAALSLTNRSQEEVNPLTPLVVSGSFLYVQSKTGKGLRLSINDLSTKAAVDLK